MKTFKIFGFTVTIEKTNPFKAASDILLQQQQNADLDMYGIHYRMLCNDGIVRRLDPTKVIRVDCQDRAKAESKYEAYLLKRTPHISGGWNTDDWGKAIVTAERNRIIRECDELYTRYPKDDVIVDPLTGRTQSFPKTMVDPSKVIVKPPLTINTDTQPPT
jgi:hypothetical protein